MLQQAGEGDEVDGLVGAGRFLVPADELGEQEGEEALLVEELYSSDLSATSAACVVRSQTYPDHGKVLFRKDSVAFLGNDAQRRRRIPAERLILEQIQNLGDHIISTLIRADDEALSNLRGVSEDESAPSSRYEGAATYPGPHTQSSLASRLGLASVDDI